MERGGESKSLVDLHFLWSRPIEPDILLPAEEEEALGTQFPQM
jgi:hypothetical protein